MAQHPQGVRRIRKAAKLPTTAQPVTDEGTTGVHPLSAGRRGGRPLHQATMALVGADLCAAVGDEGALRMRHTPCGYCVGPR